MDYKKKYENALEWARQVINGECGFIRKEVEEVFPELKESEDERILQQLLYMVKKEKEVMNNHLGVRGMSYDDMITWLEKQRERHTPIDIDKMVYKYGNTKEDCTNGLPVNCQIRAYRQGINDTLNLVFNLEKQGKQNYEFHGIAESRPAKGTLKKLVDEIENVDNANKVEPKFKIGQRIKQGNTIAEIKEISKDGYHCDIAFVPFTAEDNWELSLWNEDDDKMLYECKKEIWKSAPTMLSLKHEKIEQWLESLKQRFKQAMEGK